MLSVQKCLRYRGPKKKERNKGHRIMQPKVNLAVECVLTWIGHKILTPVWTCNPEDCRQCCFVFSLLSGKKILGAENDESLG